ncbi:hypothetical protein BKP45_06700 [Anaerobacillus alkalidiazotrophicus]|uniref:ABC transporter domain-containing protein n=1 Tax=Anaerobacillus alkalidiazotrophicus TaxID=472963 RepID=A0A1S2MCZ9_9BACI|nr:ABC transporter ATP-binding protein [Anaerobacillus alkalidiazotrophicus]OIJ22323.1 hypothetical protein BKP45_06700 [Anaerobacillus alkalidiazotrophicus]
MIRVENVSKKIGSKIVLENINLFVEKGGILGLVGPNGAGKTTLLSVLSTTIMPDGGEIWVAEHSLSQELQEIRKKIGYVPQEIALYPSLSIKDNLTFWAKLTQVKNRKSRIKEVVELLGLDHYWHEKVERLSGGYKRRVNIAVALLHQPQVLIMDEPTVGMDLYSKRELLPFLKNLTKNGTIVIYTSHDVEELLYLSDRIAMLEQGQLVFEGSVEEAKKELSILQGVIG